MLTAHSEPSGFVLFFKDPMFFLILLKMFTMTTCEFLEHVTQRSMLR